MEFEFSHEMTNILLSFYNGIISIADFQERFNNSELVFHELGKSYVELVEIYYGSILAAKEVKDLIEKLYHTSENGLVYNDFLWMLGYSDCGFKSIRSKISRLAYLLTYQSGFEFVPIKLKGYESLIGDAVDSYSNADPSKMNYLIDCYERDALYLIEDLKKDIELGETVLDSLPRDYKEE